jgi:hypothetical protein
MKVSKSRYQTVTWPVELADKTDASLAAIGLYAHIAKWICDGANYKEIHQKLYEMCKKDRVAWDAYNELCRLKELTSMDENCNIELRMKWEDSK